MDKHLKTTGVILRRINLNEADQILTVLTKDYGKISLIAKGSRRLKSRFCGRLEPFYLVELNYFQGRDLSHLNEAELISGFNTQDLNLRTKSVLFYIAELSSKLIADSQDSEEIYQLMVDTLLNLEDEASETILYAYMVKLMTLLGFMGPWDTCSRSNIKLNLKEPLYLSSQDASIIRSGYASGVDVRLTPSVIKWINFMQKETLLNIKMVKPSPGERAEVWHIMQSVFKDTLNYPLKSESFLALTSY